jgi:prepilin-type N-terminal cleavage/methylation domain-containing protein
MRADTKSGNSPRRRLIAVDWQDCAWQPRIVVRHPSPLDFRSPRRNFVFSKTMKTNLPHSRRNRPGFTLIELLVVISIIAILAALLLPVLASVHKHALMTKAHLETVDIATAIQAYDSAYGRFPVSAAAQATASPDFTYGGSVLASAGFTGATTTTNSEVIAILMDLTNYPGGGPTINTNYQKNPQQTIFLNAHMSGDTSSPGVGTDLVYRDPWGNPYIISMDLNYDEMCNDAFYSLAKISSSTGADGGSGINGLVEPPNTVNDYQFRGKVMVWSAGPDGQIDNTGNSTAVQGANKDNVLSWK